MSDDFTPTIARLRADARLGQRDALLAIGEALRLPLEVEDDGSEYLRTSPDTTLDVHVEDSDPQFPLLLTVWHWESRSEAKAAAAELRRVVAAATGWTVVAVD